MHIDTDKALAWLDRLRDGVENSNHLAELTVTRAMAADKMAAMLDRLANDPVITLAADAKDLLDSIERDQF